MRGINIISKIALVLRLESEIVTLPINGTEFLVGIEAGVYGTKVGGDVNFSVTEKVGCVKYVRTVEI